MSHVEDQQNEGNTSEMHADGDSEGSTSHIENRLDGGNVQPQQSQAVAAHMQALQRRKIAQLEEKLEALQSGRAVKERCRRYRTYWVALLTISVRQTVWYVAKGRAIRCVITLFDSIKDLVAENDRRYESEDPDNTIE